MDDNKIIDYHSSNRCKYLINIHLAFAIKYRKKLLVGDIKDDLLQIVHDICKEKNWIIKAMECDIDHIHILLDIQPKYSIHYIVHRLKQLSTYRIYLKHSKMLKTHFWKCNTFWSDGYFACSTGDASTDTIKKYIDTQG